MHKFKKDWKEKFDHPQNGDLKVWWIPQVPGKPFEVPVKSLSRGRFLLDTLAEYDLFQLEHHIKPDYANVGGLMIFDENEWMDWEHPETGESIENLDFEEIERLDQNDTAT